MVKPFAVAVALLSTVTIAHANEADDLLSFMDNDARVVHYAPIYDASEHTKREVLCLALNIYHEARIDLATAPSDAWGVGFTTLNRVKQPGFPDTICAVVFQKTDMRHFVKVKVGKNNHYIKNIPQFSWTMLEVDKLVPHEKEAWLIIQQIAWKLYTEPHLKDITHGATHFYAPKLAEPKWRKEARHVVQLGDHKFMQLASTVH